MAIQLFHADTDEQIAATFAVMQQLRPHLQRSEYGAQIRSLMASDGLRLLALADGEVVRAVAAYRVMNMLYCGRALFIDDLVSDEHARSLGYGAQLIARLRDEAQTLGCSEVQLISRVTREQAHRFYFREGFGIECFHFRSKLA
ncbi:GNAT family N-acetyltransferase [Dyella halodurans]|uniref:GNAT family N-acetyltransferase n=1 Tax=Dyella halodurans TaxID=1920171 RepID=A0ABV9BYD7_9GAMM|nr:GNAT family N-acetyltransferase [Dyella halodurans]